MENNNDPARVDAAAAAANNVNNDNNNNHQPAGAQGEGNAVAAAGVAPPAGKTFLAQAVYSQANRNSGVPCQFLIPFFPYADGVEVNEEAQDNADGALPAAVNVVAVGAAVGGGLAAAQPPAPDRPSLLALTWTFFTSFFASLIPEQPGVI